MLHLVLSPAKTLDEDSEYNPKLSSLPPCLQDSQDLAELLKKLSSKELGKLLKISEKLATLNTQRYQNFSIPYPKKGPKSCLFMFQGDVYQGLEAHSLKPPTLRYAQKHLSILSGLYGLLSPFDLILPYRLEMGTKLKNSKGNNLYDFWGDKLQTCLFEKMKKAKDKVLINLASQEYFKALLPDSFPLPIVDIAFKNFRSDQYKIVSFLAKKARGKMARYILENQLQSIEDLQYFSEDGYCFSKKESSDNSLIFKSKR